MHFPLSLLILLTPFPAFSLTFKLFAGHPPYQSTSYELPLTSDLGPSFPKTGLRKKTILWIKESTLHWMIHLENQGNTIVQVEKSSFKILKNIYLNLTPDAVCAPITLRKQLNTLLKKHPSNKPVTTIFYPSKSSVPNWIIPLSKDKLQQKISFLSDQEPWIHALAYAYSPTLATETFVLKKLLIKNQNRFTFKKEKKEILKSDDSLKISKEDHFLILGASLEEIHLAMGNCLKTWNQKETLFSIILSSSLEYKEQLSKALDYPCKTLWIFLPQNNHRSILKHLKNRLTLPSNVFLAYYATPWKEEWNFYHYQKDYGTHLNAWRGLIPLKKKQDLDSLNSLGSTTAECYLINTLHRTH